MKQIVIEITAQGEVKIEAVGFKGKACEAATKALEEAMGTKTSFKKKPEYSQEVESVQNISR